MSIEMSIEMSNNVQRPESDNQKPLEPIPLLDLFHVKRNSEILFKPIILLDLFHAKYINGSQTAPSRRSRAVHQPPQLISASRDTGSYGVLGGPKSPYLFSAQRNNNIS